MSNMRIICIFVVFIVSITCIKSSSLNKCPTLDALEHFDLLEFSNTIWFEVARYDNSFEKKTTCVLLTHRMTDDYCRVSISGILENSTDFAESRVKYAPGREGSGYLTISLKFAAPKVIYTSPLYVVDYEKDNFLIFYGCKDDDNIKMEIAWILSTTPQISEEVQKRIDKVVNNKNIFNKEKFLMVDNSDSICNNNI